MYKLHAAKVSMIITNLPMVSDIYRTCISAGFLVIFYFLSFSTIITHWFKENVSFTETFSHRCRVSTRLEISYASLYYERLE
jgi:hypothetical protein